MKIIIKKEDSAVNRGAISFITKKICYGNINDNGDTVIDIINGTAEDLVKLTDADIQFQVLIVNNKKTSLIKEYWKPVTLVIFMVIGSLLAYDSSYIKETDPYVMVGGAALCLIFATVLIHNNFYYIGLLLALISAYGFTRFYIMEIPGETELPFIKPAKLILYLIIAILFFLKNFKYLTKK